MRDDSLFRPLFLFFPPLFIPLQKKYEYKTSLHCTAPALPYQHRPQHENKIYEEAQPQPLFQTERYGFILKSDMQEDMYVPFDSDIEFF